MERKVKGISPENKAAEMLARGTDLATLRAKHPARAARMAAVNEARRLLLGSDKIVSVYDAAAKIPDGYAVEFIPDAAVAAYRSHLATMFSTADAIRQEAVTLSDRQHAGEALIYARVRCGEVAKTRRADPADKGKKSLTSIKAFALEIGRDRSLVQQDIRMADHPQIVKQVVADAYKTDKAASPEMVLREIGRQEGKSDHKAAKQGHDKARTLGQAVKFAENGCRILISNLPRIVKEWDGIDAKDRQQIVKQVAQIRTLIGKLGHKK